MVENNSTDGAVALQESAAVVTNDAKGDSSAGGSQQRNSHQSTTGSEVGDNSSCTAAIASGDSPAASTDRQLLTFEEDLWDQLDRVTAYHKHGSSMVLGL